MQHQDNPSEEISQLAVNICASLYGVMPHTHLYRSARGHVFRLEFSDGRESRILKIAKIGCEEDVLREQQILPSLHRRGFEVPCIEYTQEGSDFGLPFTIMDFAKGNGMEALGRMPPTVAQASYEHLGHFMARLSVLDISTIPGAQTASRICEHLEHNRTKYREVLRCHSRFTPRLMELFERGYDLQHETTGFAHWDGPQVITDGGSTFAVIDWGLAGAAHPLYDLSTFLMWHGFSVQQMKCLPLYPEWRAAVLHGYLGGRPLNNTKRMYIHLLGMSFSVRQAMALAQDNHPKAVDFLTFIEVEDAAFQFAS